MMIETVVYDVQTGSEEIKEVEETIEKPETPPEQSVEEKVQELQKNVLNLQSVLISQKISGGGITITDSSTLPIKDFAMQGKTEQEENPSIESPKEIVNAGNDGSVGMKVTGKNLFDISKLKIEHDEEKIIIKQTDVYLKLAENFEDNTRYTVSFESYKNDGSGNHVLFEYVYTDGSRSEWYANSIPVKGFASSANKTIDYLWIRNPWKAYAEITKIQVEKGTERTVYEPYKDPQVIAIPLDRPFTKWDRLEKRDGVYGIVCKSKEVVFDGSGDEIWRNQTDLIGNTQFYITLDDSSIKNTPDFIDNFYCDKFTKTSKTGDIAIGEVRYGILKYTFAPVFKPKDEVNTLSLWRNLLKENTIKVTYITDAEEFVPLPEETQIALNALHTYYPTTIISNSEDCEMEVEYIADTKNYIDKKFVELSASIVATQKALL